MRTTCYLVAAMLLPAPVYAIEPDLHYSFDVDGIEEQGSGLNLKLQNASVVPDSVVGSGSLSCGQGAYAVGDDAVAFEPPSFTISAWVHLPDPNACERGGAAHPHCTVVAKGNTDDHPNGYWLAVVGGQLRMTVSNNHRGLSIYGDTVAAGAWEHLAATYDATSQSLALYQNGTQTAGGSTPFGLAYGSEDFMVCKMWSRSYGLVGNVDELKLFALAMTSAEVADLFALETAVDSDGDGVLDPNDACPYEDATGFDQDGDGCLDDSDGDGLTDDLDQCILSDDTLSDATDFDGCTVADSCPCDGEWRTHGDYVGCVTRTANDFKKDGLISGAEKGRITSQAAGSVCGR